MRIFWLAMLLAFLCPAKIYAVSTDILSFPISISDEKFNITVQVASASAGTNYLRVDLYKDGTKNYFGETDSGQAWYGGSDGKLYFPVTIISGTPTVATISARLGEPSQSDYEGPGSYKIRVRRYTASGSQGSEDTISKDISITKTWPSPSPSPTVAPTPTPSPSPTLSPTIVPTPTPKPSPTPLPSPSVLDDSEASVAGVSTEIDLSGYGSSPSPTLQGQTLTAQAGLQAPSLNHSRLKTVLLIGSGLIILSITSFFGYHRYLRLKGSDLEG
jgi:hypothetical protein